MDAERKPGAKHTYPTVLDQTFFEQFLLAVETKIKQDGKMNNIGISLLDKMLCTRFNDLIGTVYEAKARDERDRMITTLAANRRR